MALAFIHGVGNRDDRDYQRGVAARDALFRRYVYPALKLAGEPGPFNAYWGGDAAKFRFNHQSLPKDDIEDFGGDDDPDAILLSEATGGAEIDANAPVSELARRSSVEDAVDLIWTTAAQDIQDESAADELAQWAYQVSNLMPELEANPTLKNSTDDEQWLNTLAARIETATKSDTEDKVEAFGGERIWDWITESTTRIKSAAGRISGEAATKLFRAQLHRQAAVFFGDVFTYLDQRGDLASPGPIVNDVAKTLEDAKKDGPLIVVAHSMGGPIVYDVLSHYRTDLEVDKLVTVGSQVGLFEELCLLQKGKLAGCPPGPAKVSQVANIKEWINVFDRNDLLSFVAAPIFEGAKDFEYRTGKGIFAAHGAYFTMPSFFKRLAERVQV
jgi:hypothetical protein